MTSRPQAVQAGLHCSKTHNYMQGNCTHWLETHREVVQHVAFKIKGLKVMESALKEEVQSLSKAFKKYILYTKLTGKRMVIAFAS